MLKSEMEAEIKTLEELRLQYIEIITELESDKASIIQANNIMQSTIEVLEKKVDHFVARADLTEQFLEDKTNDYIRLNDKHTALVKKLEALEASLDTIAMAATAGLAVTEL